MGQTTEERRRSDARGAHSWGLLFSFFTSRRTQPVSAAQLEYRNGARRAFSPARLSADTAAHLVSNLNYAVQPAEVHGRERRAPTEDKLANRLQPRQIGGRELGARVALVQRHQAWQAVHIEEPQQCSDTRLSRSSNIEEPQQ